MGHGIKVMHAAREAGVMKRLVAVSIFLAISLSARAEEKKDDGFVPLFNGKDLTGWEVKNDKSEKVDNKDVWTVVDGVLKAKAGTGWLGTTKMYGDFILRLEWRVPENGNSGVYLRVPEGKLDKLPTFIGMEIQILDDDGPQYKGKLKEWQYSGSLYGVNPASKRVYKGANQWNSFEISCIGDKVTVIFNGEKVVESDMSKEPELMKRPRKGYIGLQNHATPVEFRNIRIKVLDR
jgi:hypothetical protein